MARNRPLLPNLASAAQSSPASATLGAAHSAGLTTAPFVRQTRKGACEACRRRKSKCNGAQPCCQVCLSKGTNCLYIIDDSSTSLKSKNVRLKKDLSSMLELLWDLQTKSAPAAKKLLDQIRTGEDISALLHSGNLDKLAARRNDRAERNAEPSPPTSLESEHLSDALVTPALSSRPQASPSDNTTPSFDVATPPSENTTPPRDGWDDVPLASIEPTTNSEAPVDLVNVSEMPVVDPVALKNAVSYFHECTGALLHTFTKEEALEILAELSMNSTSQMSKATLCEVSILAAVSALYSRGTIGPEQIEALYTTAKRYLDDAIEADALRAMKVCMLLAAYNIVHKATVALAYIELGLRLANWQGFYNNNRPATLSEARWTDGKQVFRTLMFSKGWLSATLGYVSDDGASVEMLGRYNEDLDVELGTDEIIQTEIAKISTLKAQLLRVLFRTHDLSVVDIQSVKRSLHDWYASLPRQVQMGNLMENGLEAVVTVGVFFIHLQHLGAIMLVQRRIMLFFSHSVQGDYFPDGLLREAANTADEGLTAAKQSARILGLLVDGDALFNKCWLGIYQAYTSCTMIMFGAAQRLLHNHPDADLIGDLQLAGKCLQVLEHCARFDGIARHFLDTLQVYHEVLSNVTIKDLCTLSGSYEDITPPVAEYFFTMRPGSSTVHKAARDLLHLFCHPFRGNPSITTEQQNGAPLPWAQTQKYMDETSLGVHQDWKWEEDQPLCDLRNLGAGGGCGARDDGAPRNVVLEVFANWSPGHWIGSSAPSGWTREPITFGMPGSVIGF